MQNIFDGLGFAIFRMSLKQVRNMQKAGSLKPNVHESALHSWKYSNYSTEINVSYQSPSEGTFHEYLLQFPITKHCYTAFTDGYIHINNIHRTSSLKQRGDKLFSQSRNQRPTILFKYLSLQSRKLLQELPILKISKS